MNIASPVASQWMTDGMLFQVCRQYSTRFIWIVTFTEMYLTSEKPKKKKKPPILEFVIR